MQEEQQADQEEEQVCCYALVDLLQEHGINVTEIKRLKEFGCSTIGSVLNLTYKQLCSIKGFSEAKADKIRESCLKVVPRGFQTGAYALLQRQSVYKITTGSKELDKLLMGGIESRSITEVFGEFRTGKSQLCMTLCVTSQLPRSQGGGDGKVIYIDTEGTFRPERIQDISNRFGLDANQVLENIVFGKAFTHEEQMMLVTQAAGHIVSDGSSYRLLIIDSVTALFRADFSGRGELAERQQTLNKHLNALKKIAEEFNLAVVIVNQVTADPGGGSAFVGDVRKPIGGHIIAHASTTRLYFKKGKGTSRICSIFDSPLLPANDATFSIGDGGVEDE